MMVHAHATNLQDQKGVVKAGVDVLVHTLMAEKVDDEFLAILKAKAAVLDAGDGPGRSLRALRRRQWVHRTGVAGQRDRRYQGGQDLAALAALARRRPTRSLPSAKRISSTIFQSTSRPARASCSAPTRGFPPNIPTALRSITRSECT